MKYASRILIGLLIVVSCAVANAQFIDDFETLSLDPDGVEGWSFFSGDGDATMDFLTLENSSASILVDATGDRRNVWWALIKRKVSEQMIIDGPVSESIGVPTRLTISRPVLQRLIDGRTLGLAITPLGSIFASFSARDGEAPRLLFNLEE